MTVRLIVGCGYLGSRVAAEWRDAGDEVHVVSRSQAGAERWRSEGYLAHVADVTEPESLQRLPEAHTVLVAYGFDRSAGRPIRDVYVGGMANLLAALSNRTRRLIYVSSTGVYGRTTGERVDESAACEPIRDGGAACWEAERLLVAHPLGNIGVRLRLAGIYGPGRVPFLASLRAGEPIATPADSWLNLIHVADAATVVRWAADEASAPELFVVSDGAPVIRRAFYEEAARQLGAPPPRFMTPAAETPQAQRAAAGDKQVDSSKLWSAMRSRPRWPSYREGLSDCLAGAGTAKGGG